MKKNSKYIYLLKCTDLEGNISYKIGTSKNVKNRIKTLQTGNSNELILIESYFSNYATRIEANFHNLYKMYRINGEWFDLPKENVESFLEICDKYEKILEGFENRIL